MGASKVIILICLLSLSAYSQDLGVAGNVFDIKENDLVEQIQTKIGQMSKGELDYHQQQLKKRMTAQIEEPKALKHITKALQTRIYNYDPTFIVDKDYSDSKGQIFAFKGTKINPLDHITYDKELIFIDANDASQIKWLKGKARKPRKIILIAGRPFDLEKDLNEEIYFDQKGFITSKFGIEAVPAVAWQEGRIFKIQEVALED
jgi:conjugal transfer pilus assembly protein TraW